jgi:hypothetical protein
MLNDEKNLKDGGKCRLQVQVKYGALREKYSWNDGILEYWNVGESVFQGCHIRTCYLSFEKGEMQEKCFSFFFIIYLTKNTHSRYY